MAKLDSPNSGFILIELLIAISLLTIMVTLSLSWIEMAQRLLHQSDLFSQKLETAQIDLETQHTTPLTQAWGPTLEKKTYPIDSGHYFEIISLRLL